MTWGRLVSGVRWSAVPIMLLSLVAAAVLVAAATPDDPHRHPIRVAQGQWLRLDDEVTEVRVDAVRLGTYLHDADNAPVRVARGYFVVPTVSVARPGRGSRVVVELVTRDGHPHTPVRDLDQTGAGYLGTGDVVFDVEPEVLAGAQLRVTVTQDIVALQRAYLVDAGLTRERVEGLPRFSRVRLTPFEQEALR